MAINEGGQLSLDDETFENESALENKEFEIKCYKIQI